MIETDNWPVIKAKWYGTLPVGESRKVRLVVIHDMEFYERSTSAEEIARDFANRPASNKGSAHINVDNNSIVQCVADRSIAYAAPGANHDGIQVELAGYARQTREQWLDEFSTAMLKLAANAVGQYCLKFNLPPVHLTDAQLKAGAPGIVGHDQVTRVYKMSTHTDPGPAFPWDLFTQWVASAYIDRRIRFGVL